MEPCGICKDAMKEPVELPCKHVFCKPCLDEIQNLTEKGNLGKCSKCNQKIPQDFEVVIIAEKK